MKQEPGLGLELQTQNSVFLLSAAWLAENLRMWEQG